MLGEVRAHFGLDVPLAVLLAVYCALLLPLVPRWTENAPLLAAFTNDEPFITQQLDGMTVPPYGNPSNFLEVKNAGEIPSYWMNYRYYGLIYYGGTYLDLGFVAYAPLKAVGLPAFPTAPIILRAISFLAGLASLMLLYNFARRHAGRFAAIFAVTALLFEFNFVYMASTIHPDMVQFALTLLALVIAVRHARLGDLRSALVLGLVLGVIQGTKSGAVYVLPMIGLALLLGAWNRPAQPAVAGVLRRLGTAAGRGACLGASALAGFVASTPYALFDPYYRNTTKGMFSLLTGTSPLIPISFGTWYREIVHHIGWPLVVALLAGIVWFLARTAQRRRVDSALTLALVLAAANVLWFTGVGRFWVVLYYLLAGLGLFSIFTGALIARIGEAFTARGRLGLHAARALCAVAVLALVVGSARPAAIAETVAAGVAADRTPQLGLGKWADTHVPPDAKILFDDEAYFDPARFPAQATNASVIHYSELMQKRPDYFVLTDYPPGANWIMVKRRSQHFGRWSDDPYSVRLYQDLIDNSRTPYTPGPTPVPHVGLVEVAGLPSSDKVGQPAWFRGFDAVYRLYHPGYPGVQASLSRAHRLLLYRVDPRFYEQQAANGSRTPPSKPISSPSAKGYRAANAFDGTGAVWLARGQGADVNGAYVGADFGATKRSIGTLKVKWVAERWLSGAVAIERSDDGVHWTVVLRRAVVAPPDQKGSPGLKRWSEAIDVPAAGAHRMWRFVALDVAPGNHFGVDELEFSR